MTNEKIDAQKMKIKKILYLAFFSISILGYSQSKEQREEIKKNNNQNELQKITITQQSEFEIDEKKVKTYLIQNPNLKRTQTKNGKIYYIKKIDQKGNPVYITIKKRAGRRKCL